MDMLRITNLKKHFGDKEVLTGLNLSVPEHSVFGFVGENGAGKIAMQGAVADLKNVCSSHEFIVETIKADDAEYLSSVFTDAQLTAKDTLLFLGEQFKMFEVLEFITEHKILISKIERVEPSLESLFMEVVSK